MEDKIIHVKAFIPWVKEFPYEETEAWDKKSNDSSPETQKVIIQSVPDDETYRKKIAQPLLDNLDKMLKPDCINRRGLSKEAIMAIARAKLTGPNAAKNYGKKVKKGYKRKILDQGERNSDMIAYHLGRSFGAYRFRDAIEMACKALMPFIQPAKQGEFRVKFRNQVLRSGKLITDLAYHPDIRKQENDKINSLINEYRIDGIVPFATGSALTASCISASKNTGTNATGGESHCDFVPIPDSIILYDSAKSKEIRYETYKRFISEKHANKLRPLWRVIDESIRPNPDDYIGHPEKSAYFDMYLDIQVSEK